VSLWSRACLEVWKVNPSAGVLAVARRLAGDRVGPSTVRGVLELFSQAWHEFRIGGKDVCFADGIVKLADLPYTANVEEWERWSEQAFVGRDIWCWYLGLWNPNLDEAIYYEKDGNWSRLLLCQGNLWLHVRYDC
jgi:hypothetical protein